jgi:hypothetical protein
VAPGAPVAGPGAGEGHHPFPQGAAGQPVADVLLQNRLHRRGKSPAVDDENGAFAFPQGPGQKGLHSVPGLQHAEAMEIHMVLDGKIPPVQAPNHLRADPGAAPFHIFRGIANHEPAAAFDQLSQSPQRFVLFDARRRGEGPDAVARGNRGVPADGRHVGHGFGEQLASCSGSGGGASRGTGGGTAQRGRKMDRRRIRSRRSSNGRPTLRFSGVRFRFRFMAHLLSVSD